MDGVLYIVATPIGNLDDITYRAVKVLSDVDLIAAEDTRHTLKLLNHLEISKPLISYYKETEKVKSKIIIEKLKEGKNVAVVSDACPGMDTKQFFFIGFLSTKNKEKRDKLEEVKNIQGTLIFYEAPHKIMDTLKMMLEVLGDRQISICRELTKIHEEFIRGSISDVLEKLEPRGEMVVIVEGSAESEEDIQRNNRNEMTLEEHYKFYENQGFSKKDIIKKVAKDRNMNKNEVYQKFI